MGMTSWLFGGGARAIAGGVRGMADAFAPTAERVETSACGGVSGADDARVPPGWFGGLVDGLNRVPRPALALGCIGLFVYAMADPPGFSTRMRGLALVPDPLWWMLGGIVSFYFGARELHYLRENRRSDGAPGRLAEAGAETVAATAVERRVAPPAPAAPPYDPDAVTSPEATLPPARGGEAPSPAGPVGRRSPTGAAARTGTRR